VRSGDGFLCVYSINYPESFHQVKELHSHVLRVVDAKSVPFVIVGNKCDLRKERQVPTEKGQQLAEELGAKFFEVSALTRENVEEAFMTLVREIQRFKEKSTDFNEEEHQMKQENLPGSFMKKKKEKPCSIL
jgi:GTPase KRas protein